MYSRLLSLLLAFTLLFTACTPGLSRGALPTTVAIPNGTAAPDATHPPVSTTLPTGTPAPTITPMLTATAGLAPTRFPTTMWGAAVADDRAHHEIVLFGGTDPLSFHPLAETWTWDGSAWSQRHPPVSPPAREGAGMAYDPASQNILLFGGFDMQNDFNYADTWAWNGQTWTQLHPPVSPTARTTPGLSPDLGRNQVVLFGGIYQSGRGSYAINDTWLWDGATWIKASPKHLPPPVLSPQLDYDTIRKQVAMTAAQDSGTDPLSRWGWNGQDWAETILASAPTPRHRQAFAFDAATGEAMVFGGLDARPNPLPDYQSDTWTGTTEKWMREQAELPATGIPPKSSVICTIILSEKGGIAPLSKLASSRLIYDSARQQMFLFTQNREVPPRFVQWAWKTDHWQSVAEGQAELPASQPPGDGWVHIVNGNFVAHEDKPLRWLDHFKKDDVPTNLKLTDFKVTATNGPYGPETEAQKVAFRFYRVTVDVKPVTLAGSTWNDGNGAPGADGWITGKRLTLGEWFQNPTACDTWLKVFP